MFLKIQNMITNGLQLEMISLLNFNKRKSLKEYSGSDDDDANEDEEGAGHTFTIDIEMIIAVTYTNQTFSDVEVTFVFQQTILLLSVSFTTIPFK